LVNSQEIILSEFTSDITIISLVKDGPQRRYGVMTPIVKKILHVAESKKLTQVDLAEAAGVAPPRITAWKQGEGGPKIGQALKLARVLGVPLEYLADDSIAVDAVIEPPLSYEDATVLAVFRALKLPLPDVIRAFNSIASEPSSPRGGYHTVIGRRDLTASDIARESLPKPDSTNNPERKNEGTDSDGRPVGKR
jgi:transcriptional regulator with XRE-family HTH domain